MTFIDPSLWSQHFTQSNWLHFLCRNWRRSITKTTWGNSNSGKPKWCPKEKMAARRVTIWFNIPKHVWLSKKKKAFNFFPIFSFCPSNNWEFCYATRKTRLKKVRHRATRPSYNFNSQLNKNFRQNEWYLVKNFQAFKKEAYDSISTV